tara:strand:- start:1265 stop:1615 length:351 start_codon:yes stop_codon:yes gene_type:complete
MKYEIIVWSGAENYITGRSDGDVSIYGIDESKEALECYKSKLCMGYIWSYITIKKFHTKNGDWEESNEYGNYMADCSPMSSLPKYVKKAIGPDMVSLVCPDFEDMTEVSEWIMSQK